MLLLLIVALIATTAFYRRAKALGVQPGKAASLPFIVAGLFLILGYCISFVLTWLVSWLVGWVEVSAITVRMITWMANLFLVLAYLALISRNWRNLALEERSD